MADENTLAVFRRELKYLIGLPDRLYLLNALDQLLIPDAYGDYNGYTVRSVYFDGVGNDDYLAKKRHDNHKNRFRLRVYHPEDKTAKFEIKRKSYGREVKESVIISREDAQEILRRNYRVLLKYDSEAAIFGYDMMQSRLYRPVSLVEYDRHAYTHPHFNTRITLDNNLRVCDFCFDLFRPRLNFRTVLPGSETILEIKYDRFLFRQVQEVLTQCDLSRPPVSKYGSSRSLLENYYT